eukprot:2083141-Prymnesium_polylepis.2
MNASRARAPSSWNSARSSNLVRSASTRACSSAVLGSRNPLPKRHPVSNWNAYSFCVTATNPSRRPSLCFFTLPASSSLNKPRPLPSQEGWMGNADDGRAEMTLSVSV